MKIDVRAGGVPEAFGFEGEQEIELDPEYSLAKPAVIKGKCISAGENIYIVSGQMQMQLNGSCAKCSEPAVHNMVVEFEERFERELDEEEDNYPYDDETLELTQMLTDNAILNLPGRILCKDDCKGLCGICGHNLNEGECGCKPVGKNPFEVLRQLELPEEE